MLVTLDEWEKFPLPTWKKHRLVRDGKVIVSK